MQTKTEKKIRVMQEAHREFQAKRDAIVEQENLDASAIIRYFKYENLIKKEPDFCSLFTTKSKCHDMSRIFCWNCYCDKYDMDYEKDGLIGRCKLKSNKGKYTEDVWDCSDCKYPHKSSLK